MTGKPGPTGWRSTTIVVAAVCSHAGPVLLPIIRLLEYQSGRPGGRLARIAVGVRRTAAACAVLSDSSRRMLGPRTVRRR
jgi:hypothetical protein